jgi:hypothetical protein
MTAVQYMAIHVGADIQIIGTDLHLQSQLITYSEHILFQLKEVFLYYGHTPKKEHASMTTNDHQCPQYCVYIL